MRNKTIVKCASLGIPLTEEVSRQIDRIIKTLPKECRYTRKGVLPDAELVKGERADISLVSTEAVDRDGEVVLAKGLNLEYFQKNPIVTFSHKYDELPVGKAQWVKRVANGIRAKTIYSDATDLSRACWQMTQEGILKGKSIGFLPTVMRSPTTEEIGRNPEWKNASAVIESGILLEFACCPIPVNQEALVEAVAKGRIDLDTLKRLNVYLPRKKSMMQLLAEELEKLSFDPMEQYRV